MPIFASNSPRIAVSMLLSCLLLGGWAGTAPAQVKFLPPPNLPDTMKMLEGRYHTLYHDLTVEESHEAVLRMDAMTEEYIQRTRAFSGRLPGKMPFVLFRDERDYHRAGGVRGSAGVYIHGVCLMAVVGEKFTPGTWSTIQHEGFHEFAAAVINPRMPIWVNEGLAEYFGEAVFTGDGFVSGTVPHHRLERIQEAIRGKQFRSVDEMLRLSHAAWNRGLNVMNYDQAWAMTMFLAHGDEGKYQKAFSHYMDLIGRGHPPERCWNDAFGSTQGFEERYSAWWLAQTEATPVPGYAHASTQMLASYLARAVSQKQSYKTIDELLAAITGGQVKWHKSDVLPAGLATDCEQLHAAITRAGGKFTVQLAGTGATARPQGVVCELPDGTKFTSTFRLNGSRVRSVETKIDKPKPVKAKPGAATPPPARPAPSRR